ncbi:hypothetical protein AB0F49_33445 [Micromonospora ureilytica]|uniref:hypothetical protein n=1 Tax=Micromonospora ureilytica TaxID=709868 RepID=UPI0033E64E68
MSDCAVLRCPNPVEDVVADNSTRHREYGVCALHAEAIRDGAEWRPDADQVSRDRSPAVILMGDDLTAGNLRFSGYRCETNMLSIGSSEGPIHRLTMIADRGSEKEEFTFEITATQLGRISRDFARYDKRSDDQ